MRRWNPSNESASPLERLVMNVYISDLHLSDPLQPQFLTLSAMLAVESQAASQIFILGDLCEIWVGDDDDGVLAQALRDLIRLTTRHCPVYVMHGNRDFLLGAQFADDTGCQLLEDPYLLPNATLLAHGDGFCVDDEAYQAVRKTLRSPQWQADILSQSLAQRRALAARMREESIAVNANKAENIIDVNDVEVARVVHESGAQRLIHGHTHRPGVHDEPWGQRCVLGAWEHCGWLAREHEGIIDLECFALTDRYGT